MNSDRVLQISLLSKALKKTLTMCSPYNNPALLFIEPYRSPTPDLYWRGIGTFSNSANKDFVRCISLFERKSLLSLLSVGSVSGRRPTVFATIVPARREKGNLLAAGALPSSV